MIEGVILFMVIRILKLTSMLLVLVLLCACSINKNTIDINVELRNTDKLLVKDQSGKIKNDFMELSIAVEISGANNYKSIKVDIPDLEDTGLRDIIISRSESSNNNPKEDVFIKERTFHLNLNKYSNINVKEVLKSKYIKIVLTDSNGVTHEKTYSISDKLR